MKKKISFLISLTLFLSVQVFAEDWTVPADQKNKVNPQEYNLANVNKGKDLYLKNCKSCHGDPGKNNALPLVPPPVDVTSDKMQNNTEGELYYKITNGRGAMPQFKATISDDDRWRIVNYISNFSPKKQPLLVDAPPVKAKLLASVIEQDKRVEVFAEYENNGTYTKLPNAEIVISAKKAFGSIEMGKILTDENGRAEFIIPETVIGDEEGNVNIVVSLDDTYIADIVALDKAKVGQLKPTPKLIQKGILWSTNENIQIWLLFSYIAAAGGAWLTIGYIVFQIAKIKRLSKD
ncbi:MAG: cytochrome c [Bacteroidetes bacterium]|nr:MAG: cytochrome c [Bacteroidota bacterium]